MEGTCEVERIIGRRICLARKTEYLVSWRGFDLNECQWVPTKDMQCDQALAQFERRCFDLRKARRLNPALPSIDRFENEGVATLIDGAHELYPRDSSPFVDVMRDFTFLSSDNGLVEPPLAPMVRPAAVGPKQTPRQVATHGWGRVPSEASGVRIIRIRGSINDPSGKVYYIVEWSDGASSWETSAAFGGALAVVHDFEDRRFEDERKVLIKRFQRSKVKADASIVQPREPKSTIERSLIRPGVVLAPSSAAAVPADPNVPGTAIMRSPLRALAPTQGLFNIGTSKLFGVDAAQSASDSSRPPIGAAPAKATVPDALSDSDASDTPLIRRSLGRRPPRQERAKPGGQSSSSDTDSSDSPLARGMLGISLAAGHHTAIAPSTLQPQSQSGQAIRRLPLAYVYIDHSEGEVIGARMASAGPSRTGSSPGTVQNSPLPPQHTPVTGSSDDSRAVSATEHKCGYCMVDTMLPVRGDTQQVHCTVCGLHYHSTCYQRLAARFDSLGTDAGAAAADAGDFVCRFCHEYNGRSVDVYLTWRTSTTRSPQPAGGDHVALGQVDVIVKWKGFSYRHLAWAPLVWLSGTRRSTLLQNMKIPIQGGVAPPTLESKVDNNYYLPAHIIEAEPAQFSQIANRRQRLEGSATKIPVSKWALHTGYTRVLVAWQGLDVSEATWEEPPDPLAEEEAYLLWYDAFVAWRSAEMVSLSKQRDLARKQRRDGQAVDYKEQPRFVEGGRLKGYQLEGANWLWRCWKDGKSAILADEMGMGKTIQVIAYLLMVYHSTVPAHLEGPEIAASNLGVFPFLVVVPTTLVANWAREFSIWAPGLVVAQLSGRAASRNLQLEHTMFRKSQAGKRDLRCHVVLTSYEAVSSAAGSAALLDADIVWQAVVVDEGHRLKNDQSKTHQALLRFKARQRVVLTGTPLQNHLRELFCVMSFIDAKRFGSAAALEARFDPNNPEDIAKIQVMLRPYFMRRTKSDHPSLVPPKFEVILPVSMTRLQRELYKATLARNVPLLRKISAALQTGSGQPESESDAAAEGDVAAARGARRRAGPPGAAPRPKKVATQSLNNLLMEVRRIVSHPYLIRDVEPVFPNAAEKHQRLIDASGKLELVHQLLPVLKARGHRALLFAQFKDTLDILEDYLNGESIGFQRIDGDTPQHLRQARVSAFNAPNSPALVFLSTTRTGGLGLNLTSADTVIIYDCDFNPQADIQAMARAHRIGQTKPVSVFKLVTSDSAEERIVAMATRKLLLDHMVIQSMDSAAAPADEAAQPGDVEQALRHGALQLFDADAEERAEATSIKYDRARVCAMLDDFQRELDAEERRVAETAAQRAGPAKNQASDFARVWSLDRNGSVSGVVVDPEADAAGGDDPDVWTRLLDRTVGEPAPSANGLDSPSEEVGGRMLRTRKHKIDYKEESAWARKSPRMDVDGAFVSDPAADVDSDGDGSGASIPDDLLEASRTLTVAGPGVLRVSKDTLTSIVTTHWKQLIERYKSDDNADHQLTDAQNRAILDKLGELTRLRTPQPGSIPGDGSPPLFFPVPTNMRLRQGSKMPPQPIKEDCPVCPQTKHGQSYCPFIHDPRLMATVAQVKQIGNYWRHVHYHNFVIWYTVQYVWFVLTHAEGERVNADNVREYPNYVVDAASYLPALQKEKLDKSQKQHQRRRQLAQARVWLSINRDHKQAAFDDTFVDDGNNADDLYSPAEATVRRQPATRNFTLASLKDKAYFDFFAVLDESCGMAAPGTEGSVPAMEQTLDKLRQIRNRALADARRMLQMKLPTAGRPSFTDVYNQVIGLRFIEMRIAQLRRSINSNAAPGQCSVSVQPERSAQLAKPALPAQPALPALPVQPAQLVQPARPAQPVQQPQNARLERPEKSKPQPSGAPKVPSQLEEAKSFMQEYLHKLATLKSNVGKMQSSNDVALLRKLAMLLEHSRDSTLVALAGMSANSPSLKPLLEPVGELMNERAKMPINASPDAQREASHNINQATIQLYFAARRRAQDCAVARQSTQERPTPPPGEHPPAAPTASRAPSVAVQSDMSPVASARIFIPRHPTAPRALVASPTTVPSQPCPRPQPQPLATGHSPAHLPPRHPQMPLSALPGPMSDVLGKSSTAPRSLSAHHLPNGMLSQYLGVTQSTTPQLPTAQLQHQSYVPAPLSAPSLMATMPNPAVTASPSAEALVLALNASGRLAPWNANATKPQQQQAMLLQGYGAFSSGRSSPSGIPGYSGIGASASTAMLPSAATYYPSLGGHSLGLVTQPSPQLQASATVSRESSVAIDFACPLCNSSGHQPSGCPARSDIEVLVARRFAVTNSQEVPPGIKEMILATIDQYLQVYFRSQ